MIGTKSGLGMGESKPSLFGFDFLLFFVMLALMAIGVLFIYSSGVNSVGELTSEEYIQQIIWIAGALILYFVVQIPQYRNFEKWAFTIYFLNILLLIVTLMFGKVVNGARSWLGLFGFGVQPSEFMKLSLVLALSAYYNRSTANIASFRTFIVGLLLTILPMILILMQPDMGTTLVFIPIFFAVSFVAGANSKLLFYLMSIGILTVFFAVLPVWERYILQQEYRWLTLFEDVRLLLLTTAVFLFVGVLAFIGKKYTDQAYFRWIAVFFALVGVSLGISFLLRSSLKDYQIMRLIVFIRPEVDPRGSGWHVIQSLTAVGSGGLWGKGFLHGTQSHYQFLPEQSTDFIFSILAEEWGFAGSVLVMLLFATLLIRGFWILLQVGDNFAVYAGTGILFMIFFHLLVNIGMTLGIMPITGIPLIFMSYGGSSLWSACFGLALIQNMYLRRYKY